jgi:hypothetical protein
MKTESKLFHLSKGVQTFVCTNVREVVTVLTRGRQNWMAQPKEEDFSTELSLDPTCTS